MPIRLVDGLVAWPVDSVHVEQLRMIFKLTLLLANHVASTNVSIKLEYIEIISCYSEISLKAIQVSSRTASWNQNEHKNRANNFDDENDNRAKSCKLESIKRMHKTCFRGKLVCLSSFESQ